MKLKVIDFLLGVCVIRATGTFCERIINIANKKGIFIRSIFPVSDNSIIFSVSKEGAKKLLEEEIPSDITLSVIDKHGMPYLFSRLKKRLLLIIAPLITVIMLILSTQVIWHVNVIDAPKEQEAYILAELKKLGVKRGALKFTIDQGDIKNQMLIQNPDLLWFWVDIRGGSAIVKYVERTFPPDVYDKNEFYNIYSSKDAVITRIHAKNGIAKVNVGDTVLKGQLLISGKAHLSDEADTFTHALGEVFGNVWEEKIVIINKQEEIRTPTGAKTEHLSIKFTNFNLKLFINSSILYQKYDIIENNRVFSPLNISFNKKEYIEVDVTYRDNDIQNMQKLEEDNFHAQLTEQGFSINYTESSVTDNPDNITLTMRALCEEPISTERRMTIGEDNTITDS